MLVDVAQERVDQPPSIGPTRKDAYTDCASWLDRQAELESGLSLWGEAVTGVDFVISWSEDRLLRPGAVLMETWTLLGVLPSE